MQTRHPRFFFRTVYRDNKTKLRSAALEMVRGRVIKSIASQLFITEGRTI
jgi:hypothetical protein